MLAVRSTGVTTAHGSDEVPPVILPYGMRDLLVPPDTLIPVTVNALTAHGQQIDVQVTTATPTETRNTKETGVSNVESPADRFPTQIVHISAVNRPEEAALAVVTVAVRAGPPAHMVFYVHQV